jgi:hypothetical protein
MMAAQERMLDCSVEAWVDELIRDGYLPPDQRQHKISSLYRAQLAAANRRERRQAKLIDRLLRRVRA